MEKQLYIIDYESSQWCGGGLHCVAWATSEDDAVEEASTWMEECQRDLFGSEYNDEDANDEDCAYTVNSVQLMEGSGFEEYYNDLQQRRAFYPCVNA